jgi:hypothetical protein
MMQGFHFRKENSMDEKLNVLQNDQRVENKKIYTPPVLTTYGKLTDLTAGGSAGNNEPTSGPNKDDTNRYA